jgi:hypothetical protein
MKYILTQIFLLLFILSFGQVTFNNIPLDKQLIARDSNTNLGHIIIEGEVNNSSVNYDTLLIELYRDNVLYNSASSALNYNSGLATFNFNISIVAELSNYSIKVYGQLGTSLTIEKTVDDIVAGDVFIIQGQSNAEARAFKGSANGNQNNFIRVYSNGTSNSSNLLDNDEWYIGQGDGVSNTNGNTGQWGLKLANSIVNSTNIPVAIFNGAHPGAAIAFFQAPGNYQTSQASNYGRLYYRLNKTGLKDYVRAIFWAQGESDGMGVAGSSTIEYKNKFKALRNSWLTDYPNIEKYYIFQTKNGCGGFLMEIKEAQRQLANENLDISIIPTAAITHHTDSCHFPFTKGYDTFADRVSPLVQRDLYGFIMSIEIDAPMITNAYLSNNTTLVVETDAIDLSINTIAEDFQLLSAGNSSITNIETINNEIIFTLSEHPGSSATISYLAQSSGSGNFITNQNNLELICFYKYPIDCSISKTISETACDSYTWIDGNTYTASNNTATHTITNAVGCDTLVTLNLTINTVDASVLNNTPTLTANAAGATYQWIYCDSMVIVDETNQSFTATINGNYAVIVTKNGCIDTSACYSVIGVGIIENDYGNQVLLYPNPTDGNFSIDLGNNYQTTVVTITDWSGRTIQSKRYNDSQLLNLKLKEPAGVYFLIIKSENKKALIRLVKE